MIKEILHLQSHPQFKPAIYAKPLPKPLPKPKAHKAYMRSQVFLIAISAATFSSLLVFSNAQLLSKLKNKPFPDQVKFVDGILDDLENKSHQISSFIINYSEFIKGGAGALILLYGSVFPNCMLLLQAVGAAGLPQLIDHLKELVSSYKTTRKVLKDEMPQIIKAKGPLLSTSLDCFIT